MIPRPYSTLGDLPRMGVSLSETGRSNDALQASLAGHWAYRLLLVWSFVWLGTRWFRRQALAQRPDELYDPLTWLGSLAFPTFPSDAVWYTIAALCALAITLCLWRPGLLLARIGLAASALLLMAPELAFGHIEHVNHLFLLAHTLALFLPSSRPTNGAEAQLQQQTFAWYNAALLFPYTLAGLWKGLDLTVVRILKPTMTWLHPDALLITSVHSYRHFDLPLDVPTALAPFGPFYAVGYLTLAYVFSSASLSAFRRPLLPLVLLTIIAFHLTNVMTLYVHFVTTCAVAFILFAPYERWLPTIRANLAPVASESLMGRGRDAVYVRTYANGDQDRFDGFFAYRAQFRDRHPFLAAPFYLPGLGWLIQQTLRRTQST